MAAVQILYGWDSQGPQGWQREARQLRGAVLSHFDHLSPTASPASRTYATELCLGVHARLPEVDRLLEQASERWRVERMSRLDRNVLRVATYELLAHEDVPGPVVLDEAIEIAKRFGNKGSASFVNGVLHKVLQQIRAAQT